MSDVKAFIDGLAGLIGRERNLHDVNYALKVAARQLGPAVVGAMHITCSDEAEQESIDSFQASLARDLLPRLKFAARAPFRTSNLGGRYEWNSLRFAEHHFSTPASRSSFKVMLVKINAHVSVVSRHERVDQLEPDQAEKVLRGLLAQYEGR